MDEKVTYILEIRTPYRGMKQAIENMFKNNEPLYIAKDVGADFEGGELEYLADITKIKAMPNGFIIHVNNKKQIMEINTNV